MSRFRAIICLSNPAAAYFYAHLENNCLNISRIVSSPLVLDIHRVLQGAFNVSTSYFFAYFVYAFIKN